MQKSEKFQGVMIKLTGSPGGQLQKNWYPQPGEYNLILEKPNIGDGSRGIRKKVWVIES